MEVLNRKAKEITDGVKNIFIEPAPWQSVMMRDCLTTGRDISEGAKYNNYGIHGTGLANAVDALAAVRRFVFEEKSVAPAQLLRDMDEDFSEDAQLLHTLRTRAPKMGRDEECDELADWLLEAFAASLKGIRNERGGVFRAGTGSAMYYVWHADHLGATADGRRKGERLPANFSPSLMLSDAGPLSVIRAFAPARVDGRHQRRPADAGTARHRVPQRGGLEEGGAAGAARSSSWAVTSCSSTPWTAIRSSTRRSTRRSTASSSCAYGVGAATSCSWTGCIRIRSSPARRTAFRIFGTRLFPGCVPFVNGGLPMGSRLSSDRLGAVETLRINYRHRRTFTVETTGGDGFSYTWIYAEALEIDRDAQTITLHRQWNENVDVTTRYRIAGGVSPLLDECGWYFIDWAGAAAAEDAPRECEVDIRYANGARRDVARRLRACRAAGGLGGISRRCVRAHRPLWRVRAVRPLSARPRRARGASTSIAASPFSRRAGRITTARTTTRCAPATGSLSRRGAQNRETRVRVEEVEYFREDELPMPLERVKRVLRRSERRKKD